MKRIFSAFKLNDAFKDYIKKNVHKDLNGDLKKLRWVDSENYHITVKFYGNIRDYSRVTKETLELANILSPFKIKFNGYDFFSSNIFYAKCKVTPFKNVRLIKNNVYNRFSPHITLLRMKGNGILKEKLKEVFSDSEVDFEQKIDSITIFESLLTPDGAFYKELENINIKGYNIKK